MKRLLTIAAVGLLLLFAILLGRAVTMRSRQIQVAPAELAVVDTDAAVRRLSASLRFPTISVEEGAWDFEPFVAFQRYVTDSFPLVHSRLKREIVGGHTLLYTWEGSNPERKPILLLSHYDVVPVVPGTEQLWTHPPFEGRVADGYVWGRGALDDKFGVMALLEAAEMLLAAGFRPQATMYLSFGHDEEIGGPEGAMRVAALLEERGVKLEYVLDEGGAIVKGTVPGIEGKVAVVGIAEKGSVTVELIARAAGGHSSSPPPHTAIGTLSTAIHELERIRCPRSSAVRR
jgi:carboxypeptidase PM20D1